MSDSMKSTPGYFVTMSGGELLQIAGESKGVKALDTMYSGMKTDRPLIVVSAKPRNDMMGYFKPTMLTVLQIATVMKTTVFGNLAALEKSDASIAAREAELCTPETS